jgi:nicotinic acid phosphoribosyltransferase
MKLNPLLLVDHYKISHHIQQNDGLEYLYSNVTPRKSRLEFADKVVVFGVQYLLKKYLVENWNEEFFSRDIEEILAEYHRVIDNTLGLDAIDDDKIRYLHSLGHLPLHIKALPEGTLCPIRMPFLTVVNTDPKCAWLSNYLETLFQTVIWHPITCATISHAFRQKLEECATETCDNNHHVKFQAHDFSARGCQSIESSGASGIGHLLSFVGTDTIHAISMAEAYYNADVETELVGCSVPACYDKETEILTEHGFVKFIDLRKDSLVAMYKNDGTIEFTLPTAYYNMQYKGEMIQWKKHGYNYVDICVTPNHKMVRLNQSKNELDLFEAGDFSYKNRNGYSHRNYLPISGKSYNNPNIRLTAIEQLNIAFQADGSFPSRKDSYINGQIRFNLKKQRKIDRLTHILNLSGLKYTKSDVKENGYVDFWVTTNSDIFDKNFDWVPLNKNQEWYEDFLNELQYWDGCIKNNCICYSNTNKLAIDKIQAICAISGYKTQYNEYKDKRESRQLLYTLIISNKTKISGHGFFREKIDYNDYVYCVSVPSKMIVVRRNNIVSICGNTEHSIMQSNIQYYQEKYGIDQEAAEQKLFEVLMDKFPTGILSVVSDTYDYWRTLTSILPKLKDKIMQRNGTLVIRPDSGNPIHIICGYNVLPIHHSSANFANRFSNRDFHQNCFINNDAVLTSDGRYFDIHGKELTLNEIKGSIESLWETFGGTTNCKGFKVLDSHIGLIYGDSITYDRMCEIMKRLKNKGFASSNVVLGIGSYTFTYNTRDTLGIAQKATWCQIDGTQLNIFKDPKTDNGMKKSARGLLRIDKVDGQLILREQCSAEEECGGELLTVFKDGNLTVEYSLSDIRERLLNEST